jgi:hypothetical protein
MALGFVLRGKVKLGEEFLQMAGCKLAGLGKTARDFEVEASSVIDALHPSFWLVSLHLGLGAVAQGIKMVGVLLLKVSERCFLQRGHSLAFTALLKQRADHKG